VLDQFGPNLSNWALYDPYSIAVTKAGRGSAFPPLWFSTGDQDNEALVGSRIFDQKLRDLGVSHTYVEVPGAAHDVTFWSTHAGAASAWLAARITGCKTS